ncbi:HlyD family secretion protein [Tenacibaculum sp. UWU-22]|uniref:HlyD family secretion protein n=1 Tax=Tenacibaculum sp. UWU-22 TaxID=3234187 RepID=UPI0034DB2875
MEQKKKINKKFIAILTVIILIGGSYGAYKIIHSLSHEETDDAQIETHLSPIIPHVGGYVVKVYVKDNNRVKKGDTLFTLDKKDYLVALEQAAANLATAESGLIVAEASISSYKANEKVIGSQVQTADNAVEVAKIQLWRASQDFDRYENLYKNHSITTQQYEQALATKEQAEKQLEIAKNKVNTSSSQNMAANSQTQISKKQIDVAKAKVESAQALYDAAKLNLSYTVVRASIDGQLSSVKLQEGQFVQPGQSLFYLVDTNKKWVVANFKETQLTKMKVGQKVQIKVDAFPDLVFNGVIDTFSPATGSKFSLLPPDNATGNFVKTIQRLPVKITFTQDNDSNQLNQLRSGMNVEVDVHLK